MTVFGSRAEPSCKYNLNTHISMATTSRNSCFLSHW